MADTRGRQVVQSLTNKSGGSVAAGDVVVIDTTNDTAFTTTTTGRAEISIGIAQETIANNATGRVLTEGYAALVNVPASVTRGHYIETHTVAKQATGNSTRRSGSFGQFLTGGTTPTGWVWGSSDTAGVSGAITSSGLTMATARLLGRTTASTGAIEEITVGSGLSLSAGSLTATGGGSATTLNFQHYTGGDIALTSTSMAAVSGPTDLTIAATAGDILLVGLSVTPTTTTAASVAFDFATIVSASPVNYIGTRSGTPINIPIQMWFLGSSETGGCGGAYPYVVQSGDISGGNVVLRLYARVSANRSINADASNPLDTWVTNLHH